MLHLTKIQGNVTINNNTSLNETIKIKMKYMLVKNE